MPASAPVSANNTVVGKFSSQTITDANHNTWSISAQGQAVVNGQTFDLTGCQSVQVVNDVVTCDGRQLQPTGTATSGDFRWDPVTCSRGVP